MLQNAPSIDNVGPSHHTLIVTGYSAAINHDVT